MRTKELELQEELRYYRAEAEHLLGTKIASYNDDINASKDRILDIDARIVNMRKGVNG